MINAVRSAYVLLREILHPNGVQKTVNNIPCRFTARYARGIPNRIDIKMLADVLKEAESSPVVFELGGHIGTWSELIANTMLPNGQLHIFEPHPDNYNILLKQKKVSLSKHKMITVNKAVGEKNGMLKFDARSTKGRDLDESAKSKIVMSDSENINGKVIQVPVITVDDYCLENKVWPDLIKIDIEGAELLALKGMKTVLNQGVAVIVIEMHQFAWADFGYSASDFLSFIQQYPSYEMIDDNERVITEATGPWLDNRNVGYVTLRPRTVN